MADLFEVTYKDRWLIPTRAMVINEEVELHRENLRHHCARCFHNATFSQCAVLRRNIYPSLPPSNSFLMICDEEDRHPHLEVRLSAPGPLFLFLLEDKTKFLPKIIRWLSGPDRRRRERMESPLSNEISDFLHAMNTAKYDVSVLFIDVRRELDLSIGWCGEVSRV